MSVEDIDGVNIPEVCCFELSKCKTYMDVTEFHERNDMHYCTELNKESVGFLIAALQAMHDKMSDHIPDVGKMVDNNEGE